MATRIYASYNDTAVASVGTSYAAAKVHVHALNDVPRRGSNDTFIGWLQMLNIHMSSLAGGTPPSTLTIRVCRDATGDVTVVPDVTATISTGITDSTDGSVAFLIDAPYVYPSAADDFYVFFKVDSGTATIDSSNFSWTEMG